jgi:hypothetical protein
MSRFSVLDRMLGILTDNKLYPNLKQNFLCRTLGRGQIVQRYALLSKLAASYNFPESRMDIKFVVANPYRRTPIWKLVDLRIIVETVIARTRTVPVTRIALKLAPN